LIVRKLDDVGRLVIPKEMRDLLKMNPGDDVEIEYSDKGVFVTKKDKTCHWCDKIVENLIEYRNKILCLECSEKLSIFKTNNS